MERISVDVLGISEVRWPGSGKTNTENSTLYYSGNDLPNHYNGVGFLVNQRTNKSVLNFVPFSDRIALLQIKAYPSNISLIQIYAPTSDKPDADVSAMYRDLMELKKTIKKNEVLIIMGDFNAKVGQGRVDDVVGDFGLGTRNERGDTLIQFCQEENLSIANTWFELPPRRLYTWQAPQHTTDNIVRNQIDFLIINKRYRNGLHGVRTYPGTDIGSDHNPVVGNLKIKLKKLRRPLKKRIDISKLKNEEIRDKVRTKINTDIKNKLNTAENTDIEDRWDNLKNAIVSVQKDVIGIQTNRKKNQWMTDDILLLMEERRTHKNRNHQEYKKIQKEIRNKIRRAKEEWLRNKCQEIEHLEEKHDHFNIHKLVKETTERIKQPNLMRISDNNNVVITNPNEILDHWKNYIEQLFKGQDPRITDYQYKSEKSPKILKSEIIQAIKHSKTGKAPGPDDVYMEIIKLFEDDSIDYMERLFNAVYATGRLPSDWLQSAFIPIPKKVNATKCDQFRMISLMSHTLKIFLKIIQSRIHKKCEEDMSCCQFGFRQGFGTREALFSLTVLLQKCRDQQKNVYMCFIDYQKAFDCVNHNDLIKFLQKKGIDENDLNIIRTLYMHQTAFVRIGNNNTTNASIGRGVRQGCVLSPLFFNVYSEIVFTRALEDSNDGIKINGQTINNLRYADDTVIIADSPEALQRLLDKISSEGDQLSLKINIDKTKMMVVSKTPVARTNLFVYGKPIEHVSKFKYLGCWITEDLNPDKEVVCRIEQARKTFLNMRKLLTNSNLNLKLRYRFVKGYVYSVLLYGAEAWTFKVNTLNKLEAFEMWVFRRLLKISWTAHITNAEVLRRMDGDRELLTIVKRRKAAYLGHIFRNTKYQFLKLIMEGKIEGKRGIGRKKYSWLKNIRDWTNLDAHALFRAAQNREQFAAIVANIH